MPLKIKLISIPILNSNTPIIQWQSTLRSSIDKSVNILAVFKLPFKNLNN